MTVDPLRRALLAALAGACVVPASAGRSVPANRRFAIFNGMFYRDQPDLAPYGFQPIHIVDRGIWPEGVGRQGEPDATLVRGYLERLPDDGAPIVLDFEDYQLNGSDRDAAFGVARLGRILRVFRQAAPNRAYGFYEVLPTRDYWRAIAGSGAAAYRAWQRENDRVAALEGGIDLLFPSLYSLYPDAEGWERYAIAQIREARRLSNKPVYAFLWPEYHPGSGESGGRFIDGGDWRRQLDTARRYADGIVIWGGWDLRANRARPWDDSAGWWRETVRFLGGR